MNNGFFEMFKNVLGHDNYDTRVAGLAILLISVEHDPLPARQFSLRGIKKFMQIKVDY